MGNALDELASLERLTSVRRQGAKPGSRSAEAARAARARAAMAVEGLVEDLADRGSLMTVLRMVEAGGAQIDRPLRDAIRRGDEVTEAALRGFADRVRAAVKEAAAQALRDLRR